MKLGLLQDETGQAGVFLERGLVQLSMSNEKKQSRDSQVYMASRRPGQGTQEQGSADRKMEARAETKLFSPAKEKSKKMTHPPQCARTAEAQDTEGQYPSTP